MTNALLTAESLAFIRKYASGHEDMGVRRNVPALLDHIDAITASYEALVTRVAQHNNEAQAQISEIELRALKAEDRGRLALEALHDFYALRNLGDFIYEIRESEGMGWAGPQVKQWGDACQKAQRALSDKEQGS